MNSYSYSSFKTDAEIDSLLKQLPITTVNATFTNEQVEPYLHTQHSH